MQVGIFAKTFPGTDALTVLTAARAAGYDTVQYNMACSGLGALPETIDAADIESIRAARRDTGIGIAAISATYNMIHPDVAAREAGRRAFAAIAAAAQELGVGLLTVCSGSRDAADQWRAHPDNEGREAWQEMLREFQFQLEIAERHDIAIGVEPEPGNVVASAHRARALLDTLRNDRIRIVLDPANIAGHGTPVERQAIVEQAVELLHDRIALVHAKDSNAEGTVVPAGLGAIDFRHLVRVLHAVGYDGALVTHGLGVIEAASVAQFLRATLAAENIA